ncbi:MAG: hypothetical protein FWD34_03910 [Oscillospiraceae bacterium]|nr:hypothetical protein [Oscillospiraceae bacterium]
MIYFLNPEGLVLGRLLKQHIMNTTFNVGTVRAVEGGGGVIFAREQGGFKMRVAQAVADGTVYYNKEGVGSDVVNSEGKVKNPAKAKKIRVGRVEIVGDIGVCYDKEDIKVAEVHGAGEEALLYGGSVLALIIYADPKNARYSHAQGKYEEPRPPYPLSVLLDAQNPKEESKISKIARFLFK